ncbi:unnamed protein product [Brassica oleracea var. botrytis]
MRVEQRRRHRRCHPSHLLSSFLSRPVSTQIAFPCDAFSSFSWEEIERERRTLLVFSYNKWLFTSLFTFFYVSFHDSKAKNMQKMKTTFDKVMTMSIV